MINIRTITYNLSDISACNDYTIIENCINNWKNNKYFIRTARINTPVTNKLHSLERFELLDKFCDKHDIRWFNIPLEILPNNISELIPFSCNLLKSYDKAFINFDGVKDSVINFDIIDNYIKLSKEVSLLSKNGKDNFRIGLSINKKVDAPFFPFTESSGKLSFSIGLELTQEINRILSLNNFANFELLRDLIIRTIEPQIAEIETFALNIENTLGITFNGFDFSLAPIIEDYGSVLDIVSSLGVQNFNGPGIMFVTSFLTNILKSFGNNHRHLGFSGVMYSLVEDTTFSKINNEISLKLEDILKLSTMCGCGIDMIPININTPNETLISYILDIAAISCRLNKPLGVRFLPINTSTSHFDENADFITNTKVLRLTDNTLIHNNITNFNFIKLNNC